MSTLTERIAAEHWTTMHKGFHCVGCGWRGNGDHEDCGAATRRHVAEMTAEAIATEMDANVSKEREAVEYEKSYGGRAGRLSMHAARVGAFEDAARIARGEQP